LFDPVIPDDLAELFESGVSIMVATRDDAHSSELARAAGAVVHRDRQRVTVFVPTSIAGRTVDNLRANGFVAVAFSSVIDHRTHQLKGTLEEVRDASEAEREVVSRYHAAFCEVLFATGIPRAVVRSFQAWPSTAITFVTADVFLQTPGPNAGERL
jgi:hypothetical protein